MRTRPTLFLLLSLALGCRDESPRDEDAGGGRLSCTATLACAEACTTDPCVEDCLERASASATQQIQALVTCSESAGCEDDDACLQLNCPTQLAACIAVSGGPDGGAWDDDGGLGDGGTSDGLPNRFVGTTRDHNPDFGGFDLDSNAEVVFVRDDAAAPAWHPTETYAFYRLESITYTATWTGSAGGCVYQASETETEATAMPETWENSLSIARTPGAGGQRRYDFSTAMSVPHPDALTITCGAVVTTQDFNAEHNFSTATSAPTTDGTSLIGTATTSPRQWSWNLHAED